MAPLSFALATATTSCSTFFSQTPIQQRNLKPHSKQTHRFHVSCNVSSNDHEKPPTINPQPQKLILPNTSLDMQNVDRRNLLLGLGGLYSTVNLAGLPSAFAEPIKAPSFFPSCRDAGSGINLKNGIIRTTACCPPVARKPELDYVLPVVKEPRVRKPLHKLSPEELEKFKKALAIMRSLPNEDPRSFKNQAKVHCAYCNGSYTQNGQELQIHNSWLFFPFHRWYLFFFERILGHLIGDETFGLPYWNWDNNDGGLIIPDVVQNGGESNSLYDMFRDVKHLNPTIVDLDYQGKDRDLTGSKYSQEDINLKTMHRQMMRNAFDASSFFGGKYVAGNEPIGTGDNVVGSVEAGCHTAVHRWVGDPKNPNNEDMGNFYSAGYDPLFYMHHSNVDRMWKLWKDLGTGHKEPDDPDWLNASYVFYDENQNPVRVYNRDSANLVDKFYKYDPSPILWSTDDKNNKPTARCVSTFGTKTPSAKKKEEMTFPLKINETVSLQVMRPKLEKGSRDNKKEILCLKGINFDGEKFVKFDVLVNDCGDSIKYSPCDSELAGSFAAIPHKKGMSMICSSGVRFRLTELLNEIKAQDNDSVRVTIVPRSPEFKDITIADITIELIDI